MNNPCPEQKGDTNLTRETAQQLEKFYTVEHSRVADRIPSEENMPLLCRSASAPVVISPRTSSVA